MKTTLSVTSVSLKFSTNCEGCGRMFRFESTELADLDPSRWPKKCAGCSTPKAVARVAKPRKRRQATR